MAKDLIAAGTVENGQIMLNPAALSMMGGGQSVPQMQLPQMQQLPMSQQMPQMMMMQSAPRPPAEFRKALADSCCRDSKPWTSRRNATE